MSCFYHAMPGVVSSPIFASLRASSQPFRQYYPIYNLTSLYSTCIKSPKDPRVVSSGATQYPRYKRSASPFSAPAISSQALNATPNSALEVKPDQLHLWWLDPGPYLNDTTALQQCSVALTDAEHQECLVAASSTTQNERILARGFLRTVLSRYFSPEAYDPKTLLFKKNAHGKPDIHWPETTPQGRSLRFNLTHTGGLIGVAVTADALVGLDVEMLGRKTRRDPIKLANRRFSPIEVAQLQEYSGNDEDQARRFMQIWTLKEAYVKALGRGISAPPGLASFSFSIDPALEEDCDNKASYSSIRFRTTSEQDAERRWQFFLLEPAAGHVAAVCLERPENNSSLKSLQVMSYEGGLFCGGSAIETKVVGVGSYSKEEE